MTELEKIAYKAAMQVERVENELKVELNELKPCEDAVSREAIDECKELMTDIKGETVYAVRMSDIRQLPSVTVRQTQEVEESNFDVNQYKADIDTAYECGKASVRQTGEWIEHEKHLECPFCQTWYLRDHLIRNSYCPNCGADMRGAE